MNFLIDSTQNDRQNEELMKLTRESIAQNYDLARRRINATYQDVIDSGAYVGLSFIAFNSL
ncbi:hypothetical protein [Mycoplasma sp. ATU-Cv-508]|uniref:hypothetical protein n=1 Tax=Mycoplasma sp. ATU-Cv-508 TaxID=2048001 RepID=UPI000FDF56D1